MRRWQFVTDHQIWNDNFRLFILQHDDAANTVAVVSPFALTTYPMRSSIEDKPTMESNGWAIDVKGFLQAAMDAAWEMGLKPKGFEAPASELKATKYHLEDMRKLALRGADG